MGARASQGAEARATGLLPADFPRKLGRLQVLARRGLASSPGVRRVGRRLGRGLTFADHRAYVPGDDLRHLDWHLYARFERPLVRLYEQEADLSLHVLLDRSASMGFGDPAKLRLGAQLAATLSLIGLAHQDRVFAYAFGERLHRLAGARAGLSALAHDLGGLRAQGGTALDAVVRDFLAARPRRGLVVLLSDFYDLPGLARALGRLGQAGFEAVLLQIHAPEELDPARAARPGEALRLRDAESAAELAIELTATLLDDYRQALRERAQLLDRLCARHRARVLRVSSARPFEQVALRLLRRAGIVGR